MGLAARRVVAASVLTPGPGIGRPGPAPVVRAATTVATAAVVANGVDRRMDRRDDRRDRR
jgi:hypothetical protein